MEKKLEFVEAIFGKNYTKQNEKDLQNYLMIIKNINNSVEGLSDSINVNCLKKICDYDLISSRFSFWNDNVISRDSFKSIIKGLCNILFNTKEKTIYEIKNTKHNKIDTIIICDNFIIFKLCDGYSRYDYEYSYYYDHQMVSEILDTTRSKNEKDEELELYYLDGTTHSAAGYFGSKELMEEIADEIGINNPEFIKFRPSKDVLYSITSKTKFIH